MMSRGKSSNESAPHFSGNIKEMSVVQRRRVSEASTARKRRKKAFYNSRDSSGFVFHKVSSEEAREAGLDATLASSILQQECVHDEDETVRSSSDQKTAVDGASCGGVASSSAEKEGKPVVENTEAYVATQLSDDKACQQHLKQFESEMLVVKLLKKWSTEHPEAGQDAVEELREQWTKAIRSSEVHWTYYNNEESGPVGECERLEQEVDLMRKEESEWKRAIQIHTDELDTEEGTLVSRWDAGQLTGPQHGTTVKLKPLTLYGLQHTREVLQALDKEYTQLLGAMSERCEEYEEQLLTDEAKLKVRYDEAATPYTLLSKAQHVTTRLDSYK